MSKQKHNAFRRVLKVERFEKVEGKLKLPVTMVTWAIVARENSKSVFTRHLGLTVYVGGAKHQGVEAYISSKEFRVPKTLDNCHQLEVLRRRTHNAYGHAVYGYLGGKKLFGSVKWFAADGTGTILCDQTGLTFHFYACNVKGANSAYADLVTNVEFKAGDRVRFEIHRDPFVSRHCGATGVESIKGYDEKLANRYLALMEKWAGFKRNGSAPVPAEYAKDRKTMKRIAALRDKLAGNP
jgi:hypothetical protein